MQDRVRIARLLLEQVRVTVDRGSERVAVQLHWTGGVQQNLALNRPVKCYRLAGPQAAFGHLPTLAARLLP
jgi:hypothetical protein